MASRLAGSGSERARVRPGDWVVLAATGVWVSALLFTDALGCASPQSSFNSPTGDGDGGGSTMLTSSDSGTTTGGDNGDGAPIGVVSNQDAGTTGSADCPASAGKFIFVADDQNELYTFDPTKIPTATAPTNNPFNDLGPINCPGEPTPPPDNGGVNSMAVDRQATAWVNFNDGKIFKVDTTQASLPCTDTGYVSGQGGFTPQLGMGFATLSATSQTERLYVSDNTGPGGSGVQGGGLGLGWIDTQSMAMTTIHEWGAPATGYNAELSGTGAGVLYGFFTTTPPDLATIDVSNAAVSGVIPLPNCTTNPTNCVDNSQGGYAFSFWGGDFWIYTAPTDTTNVTHFVSADGGVDQVMTNIGFTIVGAGSSTCVPLVPPPPPK